MKATTEGLGDLIWATRGRSWGFRFLLAGGLPDPLQLYEQAFLGASDGPTVWQNTAGSVALRFPDPCGRRDSAGRVIPHDFVVRGDLATQIDSTDAGRRVVWPLVSDAYAAIWDAEGPPTVMSQARS